GGASSPGCGPRRLSPAVDGWSGRPDGREAGPSLLASQQAGRLVVTERGHEVLVAGEGGGRGEPGRGRDHSGVDAAAHQGDDPRSPQAAGVQLRQGCRGPVLVGPGGDQVVRRRVLVAGAEQLTCWGSTGRPSPT